MSETSKYLKSSDALTMINSYKERNKKISDLSRSVDKDLGFNPLSQPSGYILQKDFIDNLIQNGANALVLLFGVNSANELTLIIKPTEYNVNTLFASPVKYEETQDYEGKLLASNTVEPNPKCCPPPSGSAVVGKHAIVKKTTDMNVLEALKELKPAVVLSCEEQYLQ